MIRAALLFAFLLVVAAPAHGQYIWLQYPPGYAYGLWPFGYSSVGYSYGFRPRQPPMTNEQRYNRMLSGLEAKERYRKRANEITLDHKEQVLETAQRAYALKQKEDTYRSLGYLPPKPESSFTYKGKRYKNYQDFVGTKDWNAMLQEAADRQAAREAEAGRERERYQAAIVFERMYRGMGAAERQRFSTESRYNQMIRDEELVRSFAERHAGDLSPTAFSSRTPAMQFYLMQTGSTLYSQKRAD